VGLRTILDSRTRCIVDLNGSVRYTPKLNCPDQQQDEERHRKSNFYKRLARIFSRYDAEDRYGDVPVVAIARRYFVCIAHVSLR
jgi:hypothetical protein